MRAQVVKEVTDDKLGFFNQEAGVAVLGGSNVRVGGSDSDDDSGASAGVGGAVGDDAVGVARYC